MMDKKTVCVAGKNNIACDVLDYLLQNYREDYDYIACCNKTETGIDGWQKSYRAFIQKHEIKEEKLENLYKIQGLIFISTEYDRIINPKYFMNASLYNIHFSLLPAYRGMYTSALPILFGEKRSGVTLHEIDAGIDTGNIIAQAAFYIEEKMTSRDLYLRYINEGTKLVKENAGALLTGDYEAREQSVEGASYYSKKEIDYANLVIDWNRTAYQVQNQLRAFSFQEYQLPKVSGKEIKSWKIQTCRSYKKPGTLTWQGSNRAAISTVDYDIMVFFE